jgi:drug/metabolite transporter (DMT)-like permease
LTGPLAKRIRECARPDCPLLFVSAVESAIRKARFKIVAAFAAIYLIWGSTYLAIRVGLDSFPPFLMAAARYLSAGGALYLVCRWRGASPPTTRQWRSAAIAGALMLGGANGLVTWSELYVPSGLAALLVATVPFCMTALDWLAFDGPRPTGMTGLGIACGFVGVGVLMAPGEARYVHPGGGLALLLATVFWSTGTLYSRKAELPGSPLLASAMQMLAGGGLLALVASLAREWSRLDPSRVTWTSVLALAYLSVFGSFVAFAAFVWLLQRTSPALISTYAFVNPVVAVVLGWLVLSEPLHSRVLLAMALIVGAVVALQVSQYRSTRLISSQERKSLQKAS